MSLPTRVRFLDRLFYFEEFPPKDHGGSESVQRYSNITGSDWGQVFDPVFRCDGNGCDTPGLRPGRQIEFSS